MATARDARRALARGDIDFALVLLWNAVEPHRLEGDRAGLEAIEGMAEEIAEEGDSAQAREAARLAEEVGELLGRESTAAPAARIGGDFEPAGELPVTIEGVGNVLEGEVIEDEDVIEFGVPEDVEAPQRSKLTGLVWAVIIGAFILLNVLSSFLRD